MPLPDWRPFASADALPLEAISRATYGPSHPFADEWRHLANDPDPTFGPACRWVKEVSGSLIGYAGIHSEPWMVQAKVRRLDVLPLTDRRMREEAVPLLEALCRQHSISRAQIRVLESMTEALRDLEERGYAPVDTAWELMLDLTEAATGPTPRGPELDGITISSLHQRLLHDTGACEKLHALWVSVAADQPDYDPTSAPPLEPFCAWLMSPARCREGLLIASSGDTFIGLTMLQARRGQPTWLAQNFTGVVREWRGRGVGRALKAAGLTYARQIGAEAVVTQNNPANAPILALNLACGYKPVAKWRLMQSALT